MSVHGARATALKGRKGGRPHGAGDTDLYGDSMILAECIFSRSATGEVSSAYFRNTQVGQISHGVWSANFDKDRLTEREEGEEGEEEEDEEEEAEEEEEPEFDSSGDEISCYVN